MQFAQVRLAILLVGFVPRKKLDRHLVVKRPAYAATTKKFYNCTAAVFVVLSLQGYLLLGGDIKINFNSYIEVIPRFYPF